MQAPLTRRIIDCLLTLDLATSAKREALIACASFNREFTNNIDCSQPPTVFVAQCVEKARTYDSLIGGAATVGELLNAASLFAGPETRQLCVDLRREWELVQSVPAHPLQKTGSAPPVKIVRNCLEDAFTVETLPGFCQEHFRSVYIRWEPAHGFDRLVRDLIAYCEQRGAVEQLWNALHTERPAAYTKYYDQWRHAIMVSSYR